jgi:hypothetical protein
VYAQTAEVGGAVQDPSGAVIPKASVEFRNQDTGVRRQATTNSEGVYHIVGMDPGKYDATVQAKGFKTLTRENITFQVGGKAQIDFKMQVGDSAQTVTVDGSGLEVNTADASVSTVINRKFVENMPLNGKSFQDLISMTPGVVTQSPQAGSSTNYNGDFSVDGQRTASNYYTVDGVSANAGAGNGYGQAQAGSGGVLPASTALGTTQSLLSVDALQEFRVLSSTYSAEYGHSPGGQFSFATRSGTNKFHGSAFDYLRNNFFDANDWFNDYYAKPLAALRQNDFGGTSGGPIFVPHVYDGRDKSFFFFSYEGLRLTQPQAATLQYVPDQYMRSQAPSVLQPILNAYPVSNGTDYGTQASPNFAEFVAPTSLPSRVDATSVRLDHQLLSSTNIFFRAGYTPSSTSSRSLSALTTQGVNAQSYTFGATSQFGNNYTNEFRLGFARTDASVSSALDSFGGATPINLPSALGAAGMPNAIGTFLLYSPGLSVSTLSVSNSANSGRQINGIDTFTMTLGKHQIKVGIDYRRIKSSIRPATPQVDGYFFSVPAAMNNQTSQLTVWKEIAATPIIHQVSLFAQDEWRVNRALALSLGLRWDVAPPPGEENGNLPYTATGNVYDPASLALAPHGTSLWQTSWYNFAPRLGVAWAAHQKPGWETIVRSGGGVFFDSNNEIATAGFSGLGFQFYQSAPSGAPLPATSSQIGFPTVVSAPYTNGVVYVYPKHLQLPYTLEWNTAIEQALGKNQSLTMTYVGSAGRRLVQTQQLSVQALNPNFGTVAYVPSNVTANYQALQVKFQRTLASGLQALIFYSWSHSLDFGSTSQSLPLIRGNSDFDLRNNFTGAVTWNIATPPRGKAAEAVLGNWSLDGRITARTAFPVTLQGAIISDPVTGSVYYGNLNIVPDQPVYLYGSGYPGGRRINPAAFTTPASNDPGDAPRNFARGLGAFQTNIAMRKEFHLSEATALQFRAEAFNIFNHPIFGYIDPYLTDMTFGQATKMLNQSLGTMAPQYQQGGPRSMQFALKLTF